MEYVLVLLINASFAESVVCPNSEPQAHGPKKKLHDEGYYNNKATNEMALHSNSFVGDGHWNFSRSSTACTLHLS